MPGILLVVEKLYRTTSIPHHVFQEFRVLICCVVGFNYRYLQVQLSDFYTEIVDISYGKVYLRFRPENQYFPAIGFSTEG